MKSKNILDLDDACLIHLFGLLDPLPDLFNAARSCKRFRDLVHTRRSWLVVTAPSNDNTDVGIPAIGISQEYRQQFTSLGDAIAASRPGNTILLEPGVHKASNLVISHPLQILGDGSSPEKCTVCCYSSSSSSLDKSTSNKSSSAFSAASPVLSFAATAGKISNVAIEGGIGGCIAHYKGRLVIEECALRCDAQGLEHLAAPLVSLACSTNSATISSTLVGTIPSIMVSPPVSLLETGQKLIEKEKDKDEDGEEDEEEDRREKLQRLPVPLPISLPLLNNTTLGCTPGPGVVSVVGCSMEGGSTAVHVSGTGAVQAVRVIYEAHKALFWFDVDSIAAQGEQDRGEKQESREEDEAITTTSTESKNSLRLVPSWVENKLGTGFDPGALQAHVAAIAVAGTQNR